MTKLQKKKTKSVCLKKKKKAKKLTMEAHELAHTVLRFLCFRIVECRVQIFPLFYLNCRIYIGFMHFELLFWSFPLHRAHKRK